MILRTLRTCLRLLPPELRWRWGGLLPLAVAAAAMEALGSAVVFGLIKIISDPALTGSMPVAALIVRLFALHDEQAIVPLFTALMVSFYVLKNLLMAVVVYGQSKVASTSKTALSRRMLRGYLTLPYAFHLRRNSAELIRNTIDAVDLACGYVLAAAVALITEALVVVGIVAVLLATAPRVTLIVVAALFGVLVAFLRLTRRLVATWGAQEQALKHATLQSLQQSLGSLKEVKVMGHERFFYEAFSHLRAALTQSSHRYEVATNVPRLVVEMLFISGMLLVVMLVVLGGHTGPEILPVLGLYAYGGFRVIPSFNRLLMHVNSIRYGTAAVHQLYRDCTLFSDSSSEAFGAPEDESMSFVDRIVLQEVAYQYEGADMPVLHDISLTIRRGECVGLVGPTGVGKSTLVDLILGLLQPSQGQILADGRNIAHHARAWRRKLGYVPQDAYLTDDSLRRNIAFGLPDAAIDAHKVHAAVRLAQLEDVIAALPQGLDTVIGERGVRLSGGQRQRVVIARALYHEPELLVFDEATAHLDSRAEHEFLRAIDTLRGHKTLIIIAHHFSTIRACDRVIFLWQGRVAGCGTCDELMQHHAEFRQMLASDACDRRGD